MIEPFLLDTDVYFLFFQNPKSDSYYNLIKKIKTSDIISFYISAITSMEVHSVLGKYRRQSPSPPQDCERRIVSADDSVMCQNTWVPPKKKRMKLKVFHDMRKYILDIQSGRGKIKAEILGIENSSLSRGESLLMKYADRYSIGSHDAAIAGTLLETRDKQKISLTMVTFDKSLKATLREEGVPVFDPSKDF